MLFINDFLCLFIYKRLTTKQNPSTIWKKIDFTQHNVCHLSFVFVDFLLTNKHTLSRVRWCLHQCLHHNVWKDTCKCFEHVVRCTIISETIQEPFTLFCDQMSHLYGTHSSWQERWSVWWPVTCTSLTSCTFTRGTGAHELEFYFIRMKVWRGWRCSPEFSHNFFACIRIHRLLSIIIIIPRLVFIYSDIPSIYLSPPSYSLSLVSSNRCLSSVVSSARLCIVFV